MADWTKPLPGEAVEGADGHVDDHNALNAAVQEIRDYVDSGALKGAKGEPGKDGTNGAAGKAGADGHSPVITFNGTKIVVDGTEGPDLKGADGAAGKDGATGKQGEPGKDGKDLSSELSALTARVKALEDAGTEA